MEKHEQDMGNISPAEWPGWIAHLLEAIEGKTSEEEHRAVLQTLQNAIVDRLGARTS
jgi:hypothetical protein